jgi:DNA-binding NtrC family response regulator
VSRILIVDDEPQVIAVLGEHFRAQLTVDATTSGADVPGLIGACRPDVVLLDLHMDGVGGYEVLQHIHKIDPTIPVIMLTASGNLAAIAEAIKEGVFAYVPKPFDFDYLDHIVGSALTTLNPTL